ncbi:MAG TPA: hypothetical protein VEG39_10435 [Clostridia bacterium]|nr:hypothetical protein [Clostridia bacterium]
MPYVFILAVFITWAVVLIRKSQLSWHSIITIYAITVFTADMLEVTFSLLLGFYKFLTHLSANPFFENEFGIVLTDTMIFPFAFMVFVHYSRENRPWRTSLPFSIGFTVLEWSLVKFGYLMYLHWHIAFSAVFYIAAFRIYAYLAPRIMGSKPPIPYRTRLLCFSHTTIMWAGAVFSLPLLRMYQFRPGVFKDIMADCRFTDLLSGDVLSAACAVFIPRAPNCLKPFIFAVIACIGAAFALYSYSKGWLIYHQWNHFLTVLRYFVPLLLIMVYDKWEQGENM